jgi:hypothetical protein
LQLVAPTPEPQRWLSSLNVEHTKPISQSSSLVHVAHSSPVLQAASGTARSETTRRSRPAERVHRDVIKPGTDLF